MPFPPPKKPIADTSSAAVKYLSQGPAGDADGAEEANMADPVYQAVHALVIKYGQDAVSQALDQCSGDEQAEQTGAAPSDKAAEISETI